MRNTSSTSITHSTSLGQTSTGTARRKKIGLPRNRVDNQPFSHHKQAQPEAHKKNMAPKPRTRNPRWRPGPGPFPPPPGTQGAESASSPAHVATPDVSALKEHAMTALAIREKPEPRRRMDLPLRTMAQTSGVAKKGPSKDAPSRPALPERLKHSIAAAVIRSFGDSDAVNSEVNLRLRLDSPPRSGTIAPRPTRRGVPVRELRNVASVAARARLQRMEEARSSSVAQQREVNIDRTGLLLLQIHRHTPQDASADAERDANRQPVTEGISCEEYLENNRRIFGERNPRADLEVHEWGQYSCGGCRQLIARVRYECVWAGECFDLCEGCFTKQNWTYTRPNRAGSGNVGEMDEGE
jgi:hypothetical protein